MHAKAGEIAGLFRARPPSNVPQPADYPPIADYALIGDCHGDALVSRWGGIDWCALGRLDAAPALCRILDWQQGGHLTVAPSVEFAAERRYLDGTNVLRTEFVTETGRFAVTDFMPVGRRWGSPVHDYTSLVAPGLLIRRLEGLAGSVPVSVAFRAAVDYARSRAELHGSGRRVHAKGGAALHCTFDLSVEGDTARAFLRLAKGERHDVVMSAAPLESVPDERAIDHLLGVTRAFWEEWMAYCRYDGRYRDAVRRSALVLKALAYAPSGAIAAAATTSLPERIGGARNWDYRYCWLRDATFTLHALAVLGYSGEAQAFHRFLQRVCEKGPGDLQVLYGIEGEMELPETELAHLDGYRHSRPVRVGNAAYRQRQADVFGEFVDGAHVMNELGRRFDEFDVKILERVVAQVVASKDQPDQGLWESRAAPRHYVLSKVMSWVAIDRGLQMCGDRDEWRRARDGLRDEILSRGVDPSGGHLVQSYGATALDAALLVIPLYGFPVDRALFERTVERIERDLRRGDFVYKNSERVGDEGAFLLCSFWLVDAYLWLGRVAEARSLFERLLAKCNDAGLYSEEVDSRDGALLGNFPQAFTHLGLIGNAIHLDLAETQGLEALEGSYADRAKRAVGATFGWRGLWAASRASGRVGRIRSSRESMLRGYFS